MSAGICGKRLGFEEIFGSSTPLASAKRSRCSSFGSPIRSSDFEVGCEDKVSILLRTFPTVNREVVEAALNACNNKIEDAIESLHVFSLGDVSGKGKLQTSDSVVMENDTAVPGGQNRQTFQQRVEGLHENELSFDSRISKNGFAWVDIIVQEIMSAIDLEDARGRITRVLEAFEQSFASRLQESKEHELNSLKEHLQILLKDNQILKRAVSLQHESNLKKEEKMKEVQQLKHLISQYQEKVRMLELNNYTLKLHLQRAESSPITWRFHPDVF